ncbi:hypothetical protein SK128_018592 [Halocaridina rubra]|uniref:Uncharacterized protein n=1 Tax=Halocaridina rubra TaxID=373956 RepID=A0AAN8ZVW6_HALRR
MTESTAVLPRLSGIESRHFVNRRSYASNAAHLLRCERGTHLFVYLTSNTEAKNKTSPSYCLCKSQNRKWDQVLEFA